MHCARGDGWGMGLFLYYEKIECLRIDSCSFFTNPTHIFLIRWQVIHVAETSHPADRNITTSKDDSDEIETCVSLRIA